MCPSTWGQTVLFLYCVKVQGKTWRPVLSWVMQRPAYHPNSYVMKLTSIYWAYPAILFNCIFHKTKTWRDEVVWIVNSRVWIRAQARWCPDALYQQRPLGHVPTVTRKPRLESGREIDRGVLAAGRSWEEGYAHATGPASLLSLFRKTCPWYLICALFLYKVKNYEKEVKDFPCGPVVKTLPPNARGYGFDPWLGS